VEEVKGKAIARGESTCGRRELKEAILGENSFRKVVPARW
jgi:hypothetical protein